MTAVSVAAASAINSELVIILNGAEEALQLLPLGHPAREMLLEISAAGHRIAWDSSGLLSYARRQGGKPTAVSIDRITEML